MRITKKTLKVSDPTKLCLVISLEDGIKVQYPVADTQEAIARYRDFLRANALPQSVEKSQKCREFETLSRTHLRYPI